MVEKVKTNPELKVVCVKCDTTNVKDVERARAEMEGRLRGGWMCW